MINVTARIAEGLGLPESVVRALGAAGWTLVAERDQPVKWIGPPGVLIEPMIVAPAAGIVVNSTEDPREVARAVLDQVGRSIAPAHVGLVRGR